MSDNCSILKFLKFFWEIPEGNRDFFHTIIQGIVHAPLQEPKTFEHYPQNSKDRFEMFKMKLEAGIPKLDSRMLHLTAQPF